MSDEEPRQVGPGSCPARNKRVPAIRVVAMPSDTNPLGDIFGGWLMCRMDHAAGSVAGRVSRGRGATIVVQSMTFLHPVKDGDEVSVYADLASVGRSSMQIAVEAWRRPRSGEEMEQVIHANFTFVATDDDRRPRPIAEAL